VPRLALPAVAEFKRAFGMALRVSRARLGLSRRRLAQLAGTDAKHLANIERGAVDVGIELQFQLARALGMTLAQLWEIAQREAELSQTRAEYARELRRRRGQRGQEGEQDAQTPS
jgi:putative transcriptional regulator